MLIDLLNSANYIMVNIDAIHILGLNTAVYCSELLNIYKKAVIKKKIYNEKYFKIDRDYIEKHSSISVEDQLKCDANLGKAGIIKADNQDPDLIFFDVEIYASILASEDVKLLNSVEKAVNIKKSKNVKKENRSRYIIDLKESIQCRNYDVLIALKKWIDSLMDDPNYFLSKQQVIAFKSSLDEFCDGDVKKALDIINLAIVHRYVDCAWAINLYNKTNSAPIYQTNNAAIETRRPINTAVRVTTQKVTSDTSALGEEIF